MCIYAMVQAEMGDRNIFQVHQTAPQCKTSCIEGQERLKSNDLYDDGLSHAHHRL